MPLVSAVSWVALSLISGLCSVDLQDHSTEIFPVNYGFEMSLALCILEFVVCLAILDIQVPSAKSFLNEGIIICILAQLGGTFLENIWFSLHRRPSLMYSMGYFDPIISLMMAKVCLNYMPTPVACIGLSTLTLGAVCFSTNHFSPGMMDKSGFIICCLVIFYATRNISMKSLQDEGVEVQLRVKHLLAYCIAVVLTVLFCFVSFSWQLSSAILHGGILSFTMALLVYLSLNIIQTSGFLHLAILGVWAKLLTNIFCIAHFEIAHVVVSIFAIFAMSVGTGIYHSLTYPGQSNKCEFFSF